MTQTPSPDASSRKEGSHSWSVEEICQKFQSAYQQGKRIRIEDVLKKVKDADHTRLLRGLMIVEVSFRRRQGESPQQAEYESRFPGRGMIVEEVFNLLGQSPRRSSDEPDQKPVKPAKTPPDVEEFQVEVVEEGNRHRSPSSTKPRPQAGLDPFNVEIVDLPPRKSPASPGHAENKVKGTNSAKPSRKTSAPNDSLDEIINTMQAPAPRMKQVRSLEEDEDGDDDRPKVKKLKRKKKKKKSVDGLGNPMEFTIPLVLLIASGVINLIFAAVFAPSGVPVWMYILLKSGYILFTAVVTTVALFAAAAILDTDYGYLNVGLIKIGAICLTQTWMAELALFTPEAGSLVIEIFAWIATYVMFLMFFQLDGIEAIASMSIVRMAHRMAYTFLFIGLMSVWMSGGRTGLEDAAADAIGNHAVAEMAKEQNKEAVAAIPFEKLATKYGEALSQQKYSEAYEMMSSTYREQTNLEKFTDLHKQARKKYGKPLQVEAGVGTLDKDALKDDEYGKENEAPKASRRAWVHASLAVELDGDEVERCYDCWMLIVDDKGKNAVARFEYQWCD